jgi:hypothetical protein
MSKKLKINDSDFRLVFGRNKIDFDLNKEKLNRKKHTSYFFTQPGVFQIVY